MSIRVEAEARDDFAFRMLGDREKESILRAVLRASEDGLLLTDLEHNSLACNRRFGEIFGVEPAEVVRYGVTDLRRRVLPLISDPESWLASIEQVYAQPDRSFQDELVLNTWRKTVLRRFTAPVSDADGRIFGRLWTFRDVTDERRLLDMQKAIEQISSIHDPDPNFVCNKVLEAVSTYYDNTTAILSIRRDDMLDFKGIVGPMAALTRVPGNSMRDSYCQYAIRSVRPLIVQDARKERIYSRTRPARAGFTRYLGVPILDETSVPIGTLCVLDDRSNRPLDRHDEQFMQLMGMRIAAELARERHIRERLAEKDLLLYLQREDLEVTRRVFGAMNSAFGLIGQCPTFSELLREQLFLLNGLLGGEGAAVVVRRKGENRFSGFAIVSGAKKPTPMSLTFDNGGPDAPLKLKLQTDFLAVVSRVEDSVGDVVIALGLHESITEEERHQIHLEALADQVCLLLSSHVLQRELLETNSELNDAHQEILRKEKLSVVGTLSAATAHDIRNITASLSLLVAPGACDPERALAAVREQLARFNVLAHRLLSYARPRMVAKQPIELAALVDGVLELTSAQLRVSRVTVERKFIGRIPMVAGDPHQIEHLLVNLILNSAQAMDATGGTLKIEGKVKDGMLRLRIVDTGPGIPKEALNRLFEPFASTRANGFGLGLYSCKRIVEEHGGTISANRNPLFGSTFNVFLPLSDIAQGGPS